MYVEVIKRNKCTEMLNTPTTQSARSETMKTNLPIRKWKCSISSSTTVWTKGKKLATMIRKLLVVEIANLTFNLENREISQNSKLNHKREMKANWNFRGLIRKSRFRLLDSPWIRLIVRVEILTIIIFREINLRLIMRIIPTSAKTPWKIPKTNPSIVCSEKFKSKLNKTKVAK